MPSVRRVALAAVGVVLLVGGAYAAVAGAGMLDTCGSTVLAAYPVEESEAVESDRQVAFENLTARQQTLVERAIGGKRPDITGEEWPWKERAPPVVEYRGEYYEVGNVTTECSAFPAGVFLVGAVGALVGLRLLWPVGREVVRERWRARRRPR